MALWVDQPSKSWGITGRKSNVFGSMSSHLTNTVFSPTGSLRRGRTVEPGADCHMTSSTSTTWVLSDTNTTWMQMMVPNDEPHLTAEKGSVGLYFRWTFSPSPAAKQRGWISETRPGKWLRTWGYTLCPSYTYTRVFKQYTCMFIQYTCIFKQYTCMFSTNIRAYLRNTYTRMFQAIYVHI